MAQRKGTSRGRRRQAAKAPVIDLEAKEVAEESDAPAESQKETPPATETDPVTESKDPDQSSSPKDTKPDVAEPVSDPAEDVETEKPTSSNRGKLIAAGVAGLLLAGAAGGAWFYKDVGADYFPPAASERQAERLAALETRIASLEAANANASAALTKLTSEVEALTKQLQKSATAAAAQSKAADLTASKADEAIALAQKAAEQAAKSAGVNVSTKAAADKAVALAEEAQKAAAATDRELKSAQAGVNELKAALAAAADSASSLSGDASESAKAAQAQISGLTLKLSDLERKLEAGLAKPQADPALSDKISQLENVVAALQTNLANAQKTNKAAEVQAGKQAQRDQMLQALNELTSNAQAGQPFASALAVLETSLTSQPTLKALSAVASTGVPSAKALLGDFSAVRSSLSNSAVQPAAKSAENEPQSSSFIASLQSRLSSVIKIRPSGTKDWAKLSDEMAALAKRGKLTEMVQLAENISEPPPTVLADWLSKAKSRLALERNISALSAAAMEHLATTSKAGG